MAQIKNILIPTDFSENSRNAVNFAMEYFKDVQANFLLIHANNKSIGGHQATVNTQQQLQAESDNFQQCNLTNKHKFSIIHETISLIEAIRKHLDLKKIDYIVMGTAGLSTSSTNKIGSTTSEVITKIKCPIFVIPGTARFEAIKTIAFPTDYNCTFKNKVSQTLADTLLLYKAAVHVLNVKFINRDLSPDQLDNKSFLKDMLRDNEHYFHTLESRTIENGIQTFTETHHINLITMVAKNLNLIQRLLFNPANSEVSYRIQLPFLVIHE